MSHWIQTLEGDAFDLLAPQPEQIDIEEIAHSLGRLCRFTGQIREHYSVAQHCVLVADNVPREHALQALLHDAQEAYVGDVSAPMKRAMRQLSYSGKRSPYDFIEACVWRAIARKFAVPVELHPTVKEADLRMLMTEKHVLLKKQPRSWGIDVEPYLGAIFPWSAEVARRTYMMRFIELTEGK